MKKITTNIGIRYFLRDAIFFTKVYHPPVGQKNVPKFLKVLCDFHEKKLPSIYVLFSFGYHTQLGSWVHYSKEIVPHIA